jgi:hypothetical protein
MNSYLDEAGIPELSLMPEDWQAPVSALMRRGNGDKKLLDCWMAGVPEELILAACNSTVIADIMAVRAALQRAILREDELSQHYEDGYFGETVR